MSSKQTRMIPLGPEQWTDAARDMFAVYEGEKARKSGSVSKVIRTMAVHPELCEKWLTFNKHLNDSTIVSKRTKELVTLKVSRLLKAEFEWGQHVLIAKEAGVSGQEINAIMMGEDCATWSDAERAAMKAAQEMVENANISDEIWDELNRYYDHKQLMELFFVIGTYSMLAGLFNAIGLGLEEGMEPIERWG